MNRDRNCLTFRPKQNPTWNFESRFRKPMTRGNRPLKASPTRSANPFGRSAILPKSSRIVFQRSYSFGDACQLIWDRKVSSQASRSLSKISFTNLLSWNLCARTIKWHLQNSFTMLWKPERTLGSELITFTGRSVS